MKCFKYFRATTIYLLEMLFACYVDGIFNVYFLCISAISYYLALYIDDNVIFNVYFLCISVEMIFAC